ncbi:MAG: adenosine deaminase family protein, partial [Anaerolineae bacterium]|nr:adenosine deaminase family protein [Anaerolineae bacterium]
PERARAVAEQLSACPGQAVVGFGLGGSEHRYPPHLFEAAFARARAAGLRSYPHAGELLGAESVWDALHLLRADRIAHGVRAIEDPMLVAELRARQIALDVCPTSNVCLHVYPDYASHPLRRLYDAGVRVTLNSDDPPLFNTDLVREYRVAAHHFGFGADDLCRLSLNAVHASFLPPEEKARLAADFEAELERLKRRHL